LRKILIGVAVVVVALVGAVLIVPGLIDWNGYKPQIQAAVKDATGRDLRLDGDIALSILPSPSLSVDNVAIRNVDGGSTPDMASLESLRVNVALGPLLSGDVRVTSVTLVKPVIVLERLADGTANWDFAPSTPGTAPAPSGSASSGTAGGPDVALDSARIESGTLIYRDVAAAIEHRVEALDATISAGGLQGPFDVDGSFMYQGMPMTLDASVGRLDGGRPTSIKVAVGVAEKALNATVAGTVDMSAGPGFRGEASAEAPDLGKALQGIRKALGDIDSGAPVGLGLPFSVTSKINGTPEAVSIEELALALGESRLQGQVAIALAEIPTIDVRLTGNRLDLDALLPAPKGGAAATNAAPQAPAAAESESFALPTGVGGTVDLAIDAVQYRGAAIRQVRIAGDLVDGAASLRTLSAQLPGGTDVSLTGTVTSDGGMPFFAGDVEAVSDNLRATLTWLGVEVEGVASDRLRKASVQASISATPRQVEVSDWTMELDATKAKGGLTLVLRDRPAFGLSLEVDRINLDAYMPAAAGTGGAPAAAAPAGAAGPTSPLAALSAVDANVNIRVGEATAFGYPIRDARIDALLQDGTLTLRDVGVADLGGARATLAGVLRDAATKPTVDMTFDVTVTNVDRFARLLSTESPIPASQLGQVSLKGSATGDMEDVRVDVALALAGGNFGVKGTAKPLAVPPGLDLAVTMAHPDANKLGAVLAPGALAGMGPLGALDGDGAIGTRDDGRYSLRLGVRVAGGTVALIGNANVLADTPDVDMAVELGHPDAVRLLRTVSPSYRPSGSNLGGFDARSRFQGPVDNLRLFETALGLGAIKATGEGRVDSRGAKPSVTLALDVGAIDVDPWLPPSAPKPAGAAPAVPAAAPSREWSRERIDLSGLSAFDAAVTAKIASITYGSYVVDHAEMTAKLADGVLDVSKLAGAMFGGTFDLTAQLADRPTPTAAVVVKVRDADVRQAAKTAADTEIVSGILSYDTDLKTRGGSEFELVSALAGTGSFDVRDGVVEGFDLRAFSEQLKALDRAPDFIQLAQRSLSGGTTSFRSLAGTYTVTNGVLRSNDIRLDAEAAAGEATAVVDLPPRQMDVNARFRLADHANAPPIGIRLVGPLDNPRRIFDIEAMQAFVVQRLVERGVLRQFDRGGNVQDVLRGLQGGGQAAPAPAAPAPDAGTAPAPAEAAPAQPEPVKPEDAVRGLLRGLMRN